MPSRRRIWKCNLYCFWQKYRKCFFNFYTSVYFIRKKKVFEIITIWAISWAMNSAAVNFWDTEDSLEMSTIFSSNVIKPQFSIPPGYKPGIAIKSETKQNKKVQCKFQNKIIYNTLIWRMYPVLIEMSTIIVYYTVKKKNLKLLTVF